MDTSSQLNHMESLLPTVDIKMQPTMHMAKTKPMDSNTVNYYYRYNPCTPCTTRYSTVNNIYSKHPSKIGKTKQHPS
eukprot:scaffold86911_cov80-Attheya_sp.AAC.2